MVPSTYGLRIRTAIANIALVTCMNARLENWDDLRYFLAIARSGTLSGAARQLGVNHSTVFRRLGGLEETLGSRLFDRLPKGYALTTVGEEMLAIATRIEDDVNALDRQVLGSDRQLSGTIRMTTVEEIASILAPDLKQFHDRYPGIDLEVITEQRVLSLSRREADVAIRAGTRPTEPDLIGKRLLATAVGFYAARDYFKDRPVPNTIADLAGHDFVMPASSMSHFFSNRWIADNVPDAHVTYRSNTMLGQRAGVQAGFGIGILPCSVADCVPELVRIRPAELEVTSSTGIWLLYHADLRQTARVRAFIDFITQAVQRHADLFEGTRSCPPEP